MSNNKIKLVVEVDEYCRDAIIRHRNGTYGAQLPYYIISSAFEAIANGTPITEGDLIMFRTLMTEIANKGLPFEEVLLLIDNAKTPTEGDCISREALGKEISELDACDIGYDEYVKKGEIEKLIDNAPAVETFTQKEKEEIADAINYLLGAELLEENGYTEEVINALKSALKKVVGQEE